MARQWPPLYNLRGGVQKGRAMAIGAVGGGSTGIDTPFSAALTADDSLQALATVRNAIQITSKMGPGQQVRVTFEASSAADFSADNCSIGILSGALGSGGATVATPIELKFAGASGFAITAGQTITSDWATLGGFVIGQYFEVIIDYAAINGNPRKITTLGATQAESCTKAATNSYNSASALVGGTTVAGQLVGFNRIQVQ